MGLSGACDGCVYSPAARLHLRASLLQAASLSHLRQTDGARPARDSSASDSFIQALLLPRCLRRVAEHLLLEANRPPADRGRNEGLREEFTLPTSREEKVPFPPEEPVVVAALQDVSVLQKEPGQFSLQTPDP